MGLINNLADIGQMGSGHTKTAANTLYAPTGKVIVAIQFLEAAVLSTLVAATDNPEAAYFSHTTAVAGNGGGAAESDGATSFPAGLTIYGRWDSFTPPTSATGGVIFYFGY